MDDITVGQPSPPASPSQGKTSREPKPLAASTVALASRAEGWELGLPTFAQVPRDRPLPVVIAVGGGKGGVGKSMISANLAVRLGLSGRRVAAIDLDVGGSNLHTYFGVGQPQEHLADVIVYGRRTLQDVMQPTVVPGVALVACGKEELWGGTGSLDRPAMARLASAIFQLGEDADFVILDLGAGTSSYTLELFSVAHLGLVTVLPEPTSIENAYLFLKTALFRLVSHVGERTNAPETADAVINHLRSGDAAKVAAASGYAEKLRTAESVYPGFIRQVHLALKGRVLGFVLNQIRSQKDIDIGRSMEVIGERYFGYQTRYSGYLNYDDAAWKSLRNRRLLLADFPHSALARRFNDLTRGVLAHLGF